MCKAERLQKAHHQLVFHRLVGLDTAVDPAVSDHLPAVRRLDPLHVGNRAAVGPGTFPDLRRDGIHSSPGYVFLMASGIPDHEVAGLGALGHLPVVYGVTARRDAAIIAVFTATGIRLSELAGIRYHPGDPVAVTWTCRPGRSGSPGRPASPGPSGSATRRPAASTATCAPAPGTRRPGGPSCGSA